MPLTFHPSGKMLSPNVSIIAFSIFNCYEIFFFSLFVTFLQKAKLCKAKQKFFLASTTLASFLALDFKDTDDKEHCDQQHCVPSFIFPIDSIAKNLIVATVFPSCIILHVDQHVSPSHTRRDSLKYHINNKNMRWTFNFLQNNFQNYPICKEKKMNSTIRNIAIKGINDGI